MGALLKSLKRLMASEYSRELSSKVFAAQSNFTLLGFKQRGSAGYGLRRVSVDLVGNKRVVLHQGERKRAQTDRVVLALGTSDEAQVVYAIYDWYARLKLSDSRIATMLNAADIPSELSSRPWTKKMVRSILTNEKYIGNAVYNRTSYKLRKRVVQNPVDMWIRKNGAFPSLVTAPMFTEALAERARRHARYSDEDLLNILREIHAEHGTVTALLISARSAAPSPRRSNIISVPWRTPTR
nr:recombinase family protein [uncultured Duganella sp.]